MGLAISVGVLATLDDHEGVQWLKSSFVKVNALLAKEGHPHHDEPAELPKIELLPHVSSFPYSYLHYLRRAFAYTRANKHVTPMGDDEDPSLDPLVDREYAVHMDSHLCCHSDAEGFYVPLDIPVLYADDHHHVDGGMLGSSIGLRRELITVAPSIGIELEGELLSTKYAHRIHDESAQQKHPLWHEHIVWLALWTNANASIAHKTAIVFG